MNQLTGNAKASGKGKNGGPRKHHSHHSRGGRIRKYWNAALASKVFPWVLGITLTAALSLLITTGLTVTTADYQAGDIARRDIKAPRDMRLEDAEATEALREQARGKVLPHYDVDPKLQERLERQVRSAFDLIQKAQAGQSATVRNRLLNLRAKTRGGALVDESQVYQELFRSKTFHSSEAALAHSLGGALSPELIRIFREERYAAWIGEDILKLVRAALLRRVVSDNRLYALHTAKGIIVRDIRTGNRVPLPASFEPLELRKVEGFLIREAGNKKLQFSASGRDLLAALAARIVQPTLNFNNQDTVEAQKRAAGKVAAASRVLKNGEMIVREGERISEKKLATLRALERKGRQAHIVDNFFGTTILIVIFLGFAWTAAQRYDLGFLRAPGSVGLFVLLLLAQALLLKFGTLLANELQESAWGVDVSTYYLTIPLASAAMLAGILQGRSTAVMMAVMSAALTGLLIPGNVHFSLIALAGGTYAAINWKDYRHRTSILVAGLMIGLVNAALIFGFNLQGGLRFTMERWTDVPFAFAGGLANIIIVSAVMPLLEATFKLTTDMKLLELSDQNHPLLRQLVVRAPGTYHHSLIVGNLAEEAAEAVKANPLLIRVGAYFHDVGKIVKPEYFIENQQGQLNRHDKLSPSMSALILISHVKEGLEMALSHKLPKEIRDLICQHHGTSLIRYFFEKSKEQGIEGSDIHEEVYRYPGPRPQTREAGILMLSDMVEAASRSQADPSPARLAGLVERLVQTAFTDGQLDDCDLTLRHLSQIREAFLRVLAGIYHHRIIYPEKSSSERKGNNGDIHHKPAKEGAHQPRTAAPAGGGSPG